MWTAPLLITALLLAAPEFAAACSCVKRPAAELFAGSDAGVVARLVDVQAEPQEPSADGANPAAREGTFRYRVKRVYHGRSKLERGDLLSIKSSLDEATCGLPRKQDKRYGLLLQRRTRGWSANLCSVVSRKKMRRAARGRNVRRDSGCGSG